MRIGRGIIIPAILALAVAGSALAGAEVSAAVAHSATVNAHVSAVPVSPNTYLHG
jgi:hypothetical protein